MTTTITLRLPVPLKAAFLEACHKTGMSPPAVLTALLDGWTPTSPKHRSLPANEIREVLTNAKARK